MLCLAPILSPKYGGIIGVRHKNFDEAEILHTSKFEISFFCNTLYKCLPITKLEKQHYFLTNHNITSTMPQ